MTKRPEFKREAVKLAQQPDISCSQIALEIGVAPKSREARSRSYQRQSLPG